MRSGLRRETVGTHSLLYTWQGSDPSLKPILLMGHLDVVPVEAGTEGKWEQQPFGGQIADGFVWGRGAIDNKLTVLGTIEAVAPEAMVAPYLVVVVTDARHYRELSRNLFRFMPVRLTPRDLERMHGTNERIAIRDYERAIRLYRQLILNATGSPTTSPGASLPTPR